MKQIVIFLLLIQMSLNLAAEDLRGLYFNEEYIAKLSETKNHQHSMQVNRNSPQAIQIKRSNNQLVILELWNFHEGVTLSINDDKVSMHKNNDKHYVIENGILKEKNQNTKYIKITNQTSEVGFEVYILNVLFPQTNYLSDLGELSIDDNHLIIGNDIYEIFLDIGGIVNLTGNNLFRNIEDRTWIAIDCQSNSIIQAAFLNEIEINRSREITHYYYTLSEKLQEPIFINFARSGLTEDNAEKVKSYLDQQSKSELRLFRNSLFALYGYKFNSSDLREYYSEFTWYTPDLETQNNLSILSSAQLYLFNLIYEYEKR